MSSAKKLENTHADQIAFFLYHGLLILVSSFLIFINLYDLNIWDFAGIKSKFMSEFVYKSSAPVQVIDRSGDKLLAHLTQLKGEVLIKNANAQIRKAKPADVINRDDIIETKNKSGAMLEFGNSYNCHIRLGPNTEFYVKDLLAKNANESVENNLFYLAKGVISVLLNSNNSKVNLEVKTHLVAFGVRGTHFAVQVDETQNALVAVKEGVVEAESFVSQNKSSVEKGNSFIVTKDKGEKLVASADFIEKFDWNMTNIEKDLSRDSKVDTKIVDLAFEAQKVKETAPPKFSAEQVMDLKKKLEMELENFKKYDETLRRAASKNASMMIEVENILTRDKPKIEEDIYCLTESKQECKLFSEEILVSRGWARTFGTPRVRASIVEDLRKYLREIAEKSVKANEEKNKINEILQKRRMVLEDVETHLSDEAELENNIEKLQDGRLFYHFKD